MVFATDDATWEDRWRSNQLELLELVTDGLRDCAVILVDAEARIATWNTGAARIKGYTAEEAIGQPYAMLFPEEDAADGVPARLLSVAAERGRYAGQGWRVRKDGSRFWADVVVDAIRNEAGELLGFAKVTRDLTEQKVREDALRASEARFRLLIDAVTDYAIFWLDADGRVSSWNAGAQRIKGYTAREIVGRPFSIFWTAEDRRSGAPERALREAKMWGRFQGEGWRLRKDGSRFWASVVIERICDANGKLVGFAKITRDVTEKRKADNALWQAHAELERKIEARTREVVERAVEAEQARTAAHEAEAEALASRELAEEACRAKSRFFNAASHDLRQPIQALRLFFDLLGSRLAGTEHEQIMNQAQVALTSTEELLASLLDVARLEAGSVVANLRLVPVAEALEPLVSEFRMRASAKRLQLRWVDCRREVVTDPLLLQRIVRNFIENAVKYTEKGKILVGCRSRGGATVVEVWDTGPGIEVDHLQRIWEDFYQIGNSEGLGLGLAIVHKLAVALGHRLKVASIPGKGSVFGVIIGDPSAKGEVPSRDRRPTERP